MSHEVVQQLLTGALNAIRNGQKDLARRAYLKVLQMEPENETAYLGLAMVAKDRGEQHLALRRVYALYPESAKVNAALERLGLSPTDIGAQAAPPPQEKARPTGTMPSVDDLVSDLPDTDDDPYEDDYYEDIQEEQADPNSDESMYDALFGDDDEVAPDEAVDAGAYLNADDYQYEAYEEEIEPDDEQFQVTELYDEYEPEQAAVEEDFYSDEFYGEADAEPIEPYADDDGAIAPTSSNSLYDALFDEDDDADERFIPPVPAFPDGAPDDDYDYVDEVGEDDLEITEPLLPPEPPKPVIKLEPLDLSEDFARIPLQKAGRGGIPIASDEAIEAVLPQAQQVVDEIQAAYVAEPKVEYLAKTSRRIGENDWLIFRMQVGAMASVALLIVGGIALAMLTAPGAPLSVAYRFTQTPTPTATATPGITHTPSPTPRGTLTPEPTLPASFPLGDPTLAPPPTEYYVSPGIISVREVQEAIPLIQAGRTDEAAELLLQGVEATRATGNFLPYYWLSIAYLESGNVDDAEDAITEGEEAWEERGINVNARPLIQVAKARLELYKAEHNLGPRSELLSDAEDRLLDVISGGDGDGRFVEAYLLLADRYLITGEEERALQALDRAYRDTLRGALLGDSEIRLKRADIYAQQRRYDAALFELETLLKADNFVEQAHIRRIEIALEMGEPGLAVKYAEAYSFYIPGKVAPYMLWGDAHLAEGKIDWALQYYSRGLNGSPNDPYYLPTLLKRAALLVEEGEYELAFADYDEALSISDNDPEARLQRMIAAYEAGNIEVAEEDFQALQGEDVDLSGQSLLVMGRILLDVGEEPQEALNLIERAVNVEGIDSESRRIADAYRARAFLALERYSDGLDALARLGDIGENMELRALRGQLLLERGRERNNDDDLKAALRDFEFVLSWEDYLPTDQIDLDAIHEDYDELLDEVG
ncbi:MAG: tetratricopeptide repeat protein [Anaerolineaceae bacterium]|nr:tetratricopeptide repeat protein [Anaerolineaceae bacterium]